MIETTAAAADIFALPGESVFPESVGIDPETGDAYVGSLADGAIYRLPRGGEAEVFSGPGRDGRGSVAGVKIDSQRRLWAAGGYEGTLYVYGLHDGALLAREDVGRRPSCVNDIAFGPAGEAYVTDSLVSVVFRSDPEPISLKPWIDLEEQGVPWTADLNFNGVVVTPDRRHLVVCQTNLGRFWRIELGTGTVTEVALDGGPLEHCDGLAILESTLFVAVNARNRLAVVNLADDGASATVRELVASDAFAFPTAVAVRDEQLLVVNGQLDQMGKTPRLPFTVVAVPVPR